MARHFARRDANRAKPVGLDAFARRIRGMSVSRLVRYEVAVVQESSMRSPPDF
jgi:hypothetical protein